MSVDDYDHDVNRFRLSIGTDPIVIIVHTENPALLSAFKELPEVEEYGYWDHTDSYPEGVTGTDRKIREDVLDGTIPGIRVSDTMETWVLRDTIEIREGLRDVHVMLRHIPEATDRACGAGMDAYGDYLFNVPGLEVMPAVDTIASYLAALTVELLTEGSAGAVIDHGYQDAVTAACAALHEQDKNELARKG